MMILSCLLDSLEFFVAENGNWCPTIVKNADVGDGDSGDLGKRDGLFKITMTLIEV